MGDVPGPMINAAQSPGGPPPPGWAPPRGNGGSPWPWVLVAVVAMIATGAVAVTLIVTGGDGGDRSTAERGDPATPVMTTVPTVLILDASGSMTADDAPGPRIDAAKNAALGLVAELPDDAVLGLTTYGTGTGSAEAEKAAGCQDVTTSIPLGPLDRGRMEQEINALAPSGYTPISLALQRAADQLPADDSDQAIVLMSDGEDTCDTPPCDTAAQLKQTHPGLTISTVGFKTDGPASEQLACIAFATGGLFVTADNAEQLASRLIAVQDVDVARKSLTDRGLDTIELGQSLDDIRAAHPDFPDGDRSGEVVIVYVDCDFGFVDGVLDSIAPHDGGRTIDGVTRGTDLTRATELYGEPVDVDQGTGSVIYRAGAKESDAGYRIEVDDLTGSGSTVAGTVRTVVLCRCAPAGGAGLWTDPVVTVTPNSIGAAELGMTDAEIQQAAGVQFTTDFHGAYTTLPDGFASYESSTLNNDKVYRELSVSLTQGQTQVVVTDEGFRLGGTLDELQRVYGDRLRPYEALGMITYRGFVLAGDGTHVIFNAADGGNVQVTEITVTNRTP